MGNVQIEWTVSFGQIVITVPLLWVTIMLFRIYAMLLNFRMEHEMLMQDWAARQTPPVKLYNLPTRNKKWW